ncbi:hypothetical protein [Nocardioides sp. KR10-350]|uniref:hypothetical protein n=1 Tax=Nocardioides cheoyonin TaxID=3156615 RepID=UPI0032B5CF23
MVPLVAAGVVLLLIAVGIALWAWLGRGEGPDYAADCAAIERAAPDFGNDLATLVSLNQTGAGADERLAQLPRTADRLRKLGGQMTDESFGTALQHAADDIDSAQTALQKRDLQGGIAALRRLVPFISTEVKFLDDHCPRWLGPGQWGEPGSTPTGPTGLPTDLLPSSIPSDLPTDLPSDLPTDLPSDLPSDLPDLPTQ